MRIRKYAKISPTSLSEVPSDSYNRVVLQTNNVCELNRSPWDVIVFPPQSDVLYPEEYLVNGADRVSGNGSDAESLIAMESFCSLASLKVSWEEQEEEEKQQRQQEERNFLLVKKNGKKKIGTTRKDGTRYCNKTDGKGWKCRREAKQGHSLCEHHLTQIRSYHHNSTHTSTTATRKSSNISKPSMAEKVFRPRNLGTVSSSTPLSEFFYYSGFGPLWRKKRGGEAVGADIDSNTGGTRDSRFVSVHSPQTSTPSSPSSARLDHSDDTVYVDDDDDEDSIYDDSIGRKRIRKPVKARSLQSILYERQKTEKSLEREMTRE